jgi:hypothetical protein
VLCARKSILLKFKYRAGRPRNATGSLALALIDHDTNASIVRFSIMFTGRRHEIAFAIHELVFLGVVALPNSRKPSISSTVIVRYPILISPDFSNDCKA